MMENNENLPTVDYLYKLVVDIIQENEDRKRPNKKLKYVIYARKSTNDEEHQVKSIPEQLSYIERFLKDKDWDVCSTPVIEAESAKFSDQRPLFDKMISDIESGIYDGIIAWHPDRLARNMKEAGIIIDLLDKGVIRDLKFSDFSFENTSSGKMTLGIAFVMSKQYTDHMSDQINSGNQYKVTRGSSIGRDKHGYYRDEKNYLRPDGVNYDLICQAWKMRVEGKNLTEIAEFLNKKKYHKAKGIEAPDHKLYTMTDRTLSPLFKDTFYAGIMKIGKIVANLPQQYNFKPAISVADYLFVNPEKSLKSFVAQRGLRRGNVKGSFLRRTILCGSCHKYMSTAVTTKYSLKGDHKLKKRYYNFRCKTPDCKRVKKNVRGYVVFEQIMDFIKNNIIASKAYYESYLTEMDKIKIEKKKGLESDRMSLIQEKRHTNEDIDGLKKVMTNLAKAGNNKAIGEFTDDLNVRLGRVKNIENEIEMIDKQLSNTDKAILSYSEFVELFKKLPKELKKLKTLSRKSAYLKKILANCILDEEKIVSLRLNPPFDKLVPSENLVVSNW